MDEVYPILIHWAELYPILIQWAELFPMLIYWAELHPILIHCRSVAYLNTMSRIHSDFGSSSRQPIRIEHEKALQLRQPIRIEYYVTRVVSQSESSITSLGSHSNSSITSTESSANQNRVLRHPRALGLGGGPFSALGSSRLAIAYLNTWGPPPPPSALLTLLLLLSCCLRFTQHVRVKKFATASAVTLSTQSVDRNLCPSALISGLIQSSNSFSARARYSDSMSISNSSNWLI